MSGLTSKVKDGWARWKLAHFFLRDIQDVDVSSTPPADGDALVWVDADKKWEPGSGSGLRGMPKPAKDRFTVAASPAPAYPLTALPLASALGSSLILSLNGLVLVEGSDYTVDYGTGIVTVSETLVSADVLYAEYWTTGALVAASLSNLWSLTSDAAHTSEPDGGQAAVAYLPEQASDVQIGLTLPAGAACDVAVILIFPSTNDRLVAQIATYASNTVHLFKTVAGVDTLFSPPVEANPTVSAGAHTLRLGLAGGVATVYLDGSSVLTHTLTGGENTTFTQPGVYGGIRAIDLNGPTFDDFTVNGVLADDFNRADILAGLGHAADGTPWAYL